MLWTTKKNKIIEHMKKENNNYSLRYIKKDNSFLILFEDGATYEITYAQLQELEF